MYFSVISPAQEHMGEAIREMAHMPYGMHQWLWKFFDGNADAPRDFIFRRHDVDGLPRMYVVSERPPSAFNKDWHVQTKPYAPLLKAGQRLSFVLCANPVVTKKGADGVSRRHDVVMQAKKDSASATRVSSAEVIEQSCLSWLHSRAAAAGFELVGATVGDYQRRRAGKRNKGDVIQFSSVEFCGELVVQEETAFQRTLFQGLGHAKAFGCGLILVKAPTER